MDDESEVLSDLTHDDSAHRTSTSLHPPGSAIACEVENIKLSRLSVFLLILKVKRKSSLANQKSESTGKPVVTLPSQSS